MQILSLLMLLATVLAISVSPENSNNDGAVLAAAADADMAKLNEYIQADKENEMNVESLYADLQRRIGAMKAEWTRADVERQAMRRALSEAREHVQTISEQNAKLTSLVSTVKQEQDRLAKAKETVMHALGIEDQINLTDV